MASSIDPHSNNNPEERGLQTMPEENHDLICKMNQMMEGKSEGDRLALLETLIKNSLNKAPLNNTTDCVDKVNDAKSISDEAECSNKGESLEPLGNCSLPLVKDSDEDTKIPTEENLAVKDHGSYKDINGVEHEENLALKDQKCCEDEVMKKEKETDHSDAVSCKIPIDQKENQGVSGDQGKNKADIESLEDKEICQTPDEDEVGNISINNTLSVRYNSALDADGSKNKLESPEKQHGELVASSDDDMPPSTPASGQSSGSDLSESPSESRDASRSGDSTTHGKQSPLPTHQYENESRGSDLPITTQENSPPAMGNTHSPAIQEIGLNKTPTIACNLPARNREYASPLDTGQYRSPSEAYTGPQKTRMNGDSLVTPNTSQEPIRHQDYASFGTGQSRPPTGMSTSLQHLGLNDASQTTPKNKSEPVRTQECVSFGRGQSLPAEELLTGFKNLGLNGALPTQPPTGRFPIRTGEEVYTTTTVPSSTSDTSTIMINPPSSLSTVNSFPGIPLYYQPHIVMQDQVPVLVLRPVLAQDPSSPPQVPSDCKGLNLESIPLSFPLVSAANRVTEDIDDPQAESKIAPSYRDHPKKEELFPFGVELVSGYASSVTESEIDEAPLRKPIRFDRRQMTRPRVTNQSNYGRSSNKSYDWELPYSNPFVDSYDSNDSITSISDSKTSRSIVPTTLNQEERSLYNKQGARSKSTNKTNPFAPEVPPRTDIPVLTKNKLDSIPKSMLANPEYAGSQQESDREVTQTHRRRLSSSSLITLIESECDEGSPLDITDVVTSQINTSDDSYQSQIFKPASAPFFGENTSPVPHSSSPVVLRQTGLVNPAASVPTRQPETIATRVEPKKMKPKLPGHVAPLWIQDNQINKCCCCHRSFTLIRRKHHCRGCGKIFCSACCSQLARLSYLQYRIGRICMFCTSTIKEAIRARNAQKLQNGPEKAKPTDTRPTNSGNQVTSATPPTSMTRPLPNSTRHTSSTCTENRQGNTLSNLGTETSPNQANLQQVMFSPNTPGYQPNSITYTDPITGKVVSARIAYQPLAPPGQSVVVPGQQVAQPGNTIPQNQLQGDLIQALAPPTQQPAQSQNVSDSTPTPERSEPAGVETPPRKLTLPLRPSGRIVSWKGGSFSSTLMLNDRRKALSKDLKDLPNGVTIQVADKLQVIVKKIKVQRQTAAPYQVWSFCSNGLEAFNQTEIVILFEIKQKEGIFPEEVLRIYKVVLDLVKLGNCFMHGNFLAFNSPFLGSIENAAFLFTNDSYTSKLPAIYEDKARVLYGILVKRPELEIAKYIPMRFLLRLGQEAKSFPFPVMNSRDRAVVYDGLDAQDKLFHTSYAMNSYLKNSVPEALIPGLVVLKEDSKVVLQIPIASQSAILDLFDRLIIKVQQTATIPLSSDISINVHEYRVFHQSIVTKEVSFAKSTSLFINPNARCISRNPSVTGLGFIILHLGATGVARENHGGEFIDDGAIVYFSKFHTHKLRQSLNEHSNCYFYLGDQFEIVHFELRWLQEQHQPQVQQASVPSASQTAPKKEEFPGTATIDVRHSGCTAELKKLAAAGVGYVSVLIRSFEDRIRRVCMEPLIMQANKMRAGEAKELILRVSLKEGMKKWSIGPRNQPMSLIRSLQMALHAVTLSELHNACLVLSFDVTIIKQ